MFEKGQSDPRGRFLFCPPIEKLLPVRNDRLLLLPMLCFNLQAKYEKGGAAAGRFVTVAVLRKEGENDRERLTPSLQKIILQYS